MTAETSSFRAPRGTYDLLPPDSWAWQEVTRLALDSFALAGYAPVETPTFEHTEVFERGVGETSEVVNKEMYTFADQGGRSLTLRPEGTAPVMRAVLEHSLDRGPLPVKLAYSSAMFRRERPQKGRFRQFFQVGIEAIGSEAPALDAEVIEIGCRFLVDAGVEPRLLINSIGHEDESCRASYLRLLVAYLDERREDLAPQDRERAHSNPLRTFDSKEPATKKAMQEAPLITEHLCADCRNHFEGVTGHLTDLSIDYEIDPGLVRGLDYYTRTAFEWVVGSLGSQNAVGAGGRYDGLAQALGGNRLPGIGFALGVDRIVLSRATRNIGFENPIRVYFVSLGDDARREALMLATRLREAGVGADLDHAARGMKGQMKDAARSGARWAVILGEDELKSREATVRDLGSGDQERVKLTDLERKLRP
jgi:histidyl-tRNA synthetase